ncbi:hypothetical protein TWF730_005932 [Orbilia blumenaviensis]|uniref:Uncharacterized protein n=1 Tax=Orbilia blumenaviensis TaxID=1796055 RepID=A0AAV9VMM0_9PEZI
MKISGIFFGLTLLLASASASPAMRRSAATAELRGRQVAAAPEQPTLEDGTPIPIKSTIKETILAQIPKLDLDPAVATFLENFPASGYEQISKMEDPQLTEAITALLSGQIPAGVTTE